MRVTVDLEQRKPKNGKPPLWSAFVRGMGAERGTDLLAGRQITDRNDALNAAADIIREEFGPLPYTLEFVEGVSR